MNIDFNRINNDSFGNPRYVCHFVNLLTDEENNETEYKGKYLKALNRAKEIEGKKFNNKQFGGGIVFNTYNTDKIQNKIFLLTGKAVKYWRNPSPSEIKMGYTTKREKIVLKSEVMNRKGEVKKWFKCSKTGLTFKLIK